MDKIIDDQKIESIKKKGIVLIGGCFDIIHPAHKEFIKRAKKVGNKLAILLENDENIKKIKGEKRPLNNQIVRAENLSKIKEVDHVILLKTPDSDQYYYNLVKLLEPDIIAVTEDDPLLKVKKEQALMVSGKVKIVMKRNKKFSSSKLIDKNI